MPDEIIEIKEDEKLEERAADGPLDGFNRPHMYLPFTRSDSDKWEVQGQATAEVPDSYKTIFAFNPEAWKRWRGNIREQHDSKKAVGKALKVYPDAATRTVEVHARVSRGAPLTWAKVEDEVLTGFSVSIEPAPQYGRNTANWPRKEYQGKSYAYLPDYDIVELSLVDNPSCPGCDVAMVRADGFTEQVAEEEIPVEELPVTEPEVIPEPEIPPAQEEEKPIERAGARLSADSRGALHDMRDKAMALCGCDDCDTILNRTHETTELITQETIERSLAPVYQRQQAFLSQLAKQQASYINIEQQLTGLQQALERVLNGSNLDSLRSDLSEVKKQVDVIANQPAAGGPLVNNRSMERSLATDPPRAPLQPDLELLNRLNRAGAFKTMDDQIAAATLVLSSQVR